MGIQIKIIAALLFIAGVTLWFFLPKEQKAWYESLLIALVIILIKMVLSFRMVGQMLADLRLLLQKKTHHDNRQKEQKMSKEVATLSYFLMM
jgi:energy-converting hydrogenase Eha subunit G